MVTGVTPRRGKEEFEEQKEKLEERLSHCGRRIAHNRAVNWRPSNPSEWRGVIAMEVGMSLQA